MIKLRSRVNSAVPNPTTALGVMNQLPDTSIVSARSLVGETVRKLCGYEPIGRLLTVTNEWQEKCDKYGQWLIEVTDEYGNTEYTGTERVTLWNRNLPITSRAKSKVNSWWVDDQGHGCYEDDDVLRNPTLDADELWEAIMEALEEDDEYAPLTYTDKAENMSYSDMMKLIPKDFIQRYVTSALELDYDEYVTYGLWESELKQEEIENAIDEVPLYRLHDLLIRAGIVVEDDDDYEEEDDFEDIPARYMAMAV